MVNYKIISDSACDLSPAAAQGYNIDIVPFYVSFDDEHYLKEGVELTTKEFYKTIKEKKCFAKTSLPSVQDYCDVFTKALEQGQDILCICLSSTLSGSWQSAVNAKNILLESFPERTIEVIDSLQATICQSLLLSEAIRMQNVGFDLSKTVSLLQKQIEKSMIFFTLDSLEYLQRGGRIGRVSAIAGTLLNIKPIIVLDKGDLFPMSKVRGRKKAIAEIIEIVRKNTGFRGDEFLFAIAHSECPDEATELRTHFAEQLGCVVNTDVDEIGCTIGTHVGPGVIGFCYVPKYETVM